MFKSILCIMTQGDKPLARVGSLLLGVSLLLQTRRERWRRKKPFSQSPLRTDKVRDPRLLNEWDSDRLMRFSKEDFLHAGKGGSFLHPSTQGLYSPHLVLPRHWAPAALRQGCLRQLHLVALADKS